jgi:hypothetical protein
MEMLQLNIFKIVHKTGVSMGDSPADLNQFD